MLGTPQRFCLLIVLLCATSCTSRVHVSSEPSGARVYINDVMTGYTPLDVNLASTARYIRIETDGYISQQGILHRRFDGDSLMALFFPVLLCTPVVTTRLESAYHFVLQRGSGIEYRGVIMGVPEVDRVPPTLSGSKQKGTQ